MVCNRANKDDGAGWRVEIRGRSSAPAPAALAREFVAAGIDDLAKYQVMRLLYECPAAGGNANYFAAYLGFHSVPMTTALLEELAHDGALEQEVAVNGHPCFRLTHDGGARRRLMRLYNLASEPKEQANVLRTLANRSLLKARSRSTLTSSDGHVNH